MHISEVAKRAGVTVRTLHYYDRIGLLTPEKAAGAGYRIYSDENLAQLQQILFFRELDFSLEDIRAIMKNPNFDKARALQNHRTLLLEKRARLDGLLGLLDQTIKGEKTMSFQEFDSTKIEQAREQYAAEARERWGDTDAYKESEGKTMSYHTAQWNDVDGESAAILEEFGRLRDGDPKSPEAQALVARWQDYISRSFYRCTDEILAGLGQMYTGDPRFTATIDQNGAGTAAFLANAIEAYCAR
ncbi:MAG: MerR family transcriptional regulator [Oscillospiraceae bacterium]